MEQTFVVVLTILIALIVVPLAIRCVNRLDEWLAGGLERLFSVFRRGR